MDSGVFHRDSHFPVGVHCVIPEDETMPLYSGRGIPLLLSSNDCAAKAYRNIARRITGKRTPLMKLR